MLYSSLVSNTSDITIHEAHDGAIVVTDILSEFVKTYKADLYFTVNLRNMLLPNAVTLCISIEASCLQ